jgi:hypothetical protein
MGHTPLLSFSGELYVKDGSKMSSSQELGTIIGYEDSNRPIFGEITDEKVKNFYDMRGY